MIDDPLRQPLHTIAAAVRDGRLDPANLAARARAAADRHRSLNMFTCHTEPQEMEIGFDGPLAGIPYAAKDSIATVGLPTCGASPALADWHPSEDAAAIRILAAAGATLVGKTNMHELSFGVTSNNSAFGPVRNPYDPTRIAGGSSGGSAAAVAVGAAAFALAADTGGSVRIPAAMCGLVGFRPSTGRWPGDGLINVSPTRDTIGAITHRAEDASLLDTIMTGDATNVPAPAVGSLRLGLLSPPFLDDLDPAVASVVDVFLHRLRQAGVSIEELDGSTLVKLEEQSGFPIALHEARIEMTELARVQGLDLAGFAARIASPDVAEIVAGLLEPGDEAIYRHALEVVRPALQAAYAGLFEAGIDAIILPTAPVAAARVGEDDTLMLNGRAVPTFATYARHSSAASGAGIPSISIPIGMTDAGLPIGMMIDGPAGADRRLLAVAGALATLADPVPPPS